MPIEDIERAIQEFDAGVATEGPKASFIGNFPDDYAVQRRVPRRSWAGTPPWGTPKTDTIAATPRYREGDDWRPAALGPVEIQRIQERLLAAGVYRKGQKFQKGMWDENTRQAYRRVLTLANAIGVDKDSALARFAEAPPPEDEETQRAPLVRRSADPDGLRVVFEEVDRATTGMRRPADVEAMVAAYLQRQATEEAALHAAQETGGTVPVLDDPQQFATAWLRRNRPKEVAAFDMFSTGVDLFDAISDVTSG